MKNITFHANQIQVDERVITMPYPVLEAFCCGEKLVVLLDPNSYLKDTAYKQQRDRDGEALKNLLALDYNGNQLWAAEFPDVSDYYYRIHSRNPLIVYSFSSFACEIDPATGKIKSKSFFK